MNHKKAKKYNKSENGLKEKRINKLLYIQNTMKSNFFHCLEDSNLEEKNERKRMKYMNINDKIIINYIILIIIKH